jgi:hypothetical protein
MNDKELNKEVESLKHDFIKKLVEKAVAYRKRNPDVKPLTAEERQEKIINAIKALCKTLPLFRLQLTLEGMTMYEATDVIEGLVVDALYPIPEHKEFKQ